MSITFIFVVILLSLLMFICGFVLAGLDFRFGWIKLPNFVSIIGCILFIIVIAIILHKSS